MAVLDTLRVINFNVTGVRMRVLLLVMIFLFQNEIKNVDSLFLSVSFYFGIKVDD